MLAFEDETWWSRIRQPQLHTWGDAPLHLVTQPVAPDDPEPKALAAYGLFLQQCNELWLRFVDGRPLTATTIPFLDHCCQRLAARRVTALLLVWDNATWHTSNRVRRWIRDHNRAVKHDGHGVRILACPLPAKSPWLNPIEPKWVHAKRAIAAPDRLLPIPEFEHRICDYFGCDRLDHLIPQQAG